MNIITCKPYSAKVSEKTCIARQKLISKRNAKLKNKENPGSGITGQIGQSYDLCRTCETGINLYRKSKGEIVVNMKRCPECKRLKKGDLEHFDRAARADDGLTKLCKDCRGKASPEKKKEAKIVICKDCGKELEQTAENFHIDPTYTSGFRSDCKPCRNKKKSALRDQKKNVIVLDFSNHPDVLEKIKQFADDHMRTPENQLIWALKHDWLKKRKVV